MSTIDKAKRIVVKVGTSTLTYENGKPNLRVIERLVRVLANLSHSGKDIILVTSGAVSMGLGRLGHTDRPTDIAMRQAMAAVGQVELMFLYDKFFSEYGATCAQVLLTGDVVDDEVRRNNVTNCVNALLKESIIPVINENDTTSTVELEGHNIGDNDNLSSIVSVLIEADSLVILTDFDGLYDRDPRTDPDAVYIPVVLDIEGAIRDYAGGSGSRRGTGGMRTKLAAASRACAEGIDTYIISGEKPESIYELTEGKQRGTHFVPPRSARCAKSAKSE